MGVKKTGQARQFDTGAQVEPPVTVYIVVDMRACPA